MNSITNYLKSVFSALKSLATGMGITGHYFVRPSKIITQQYPENRATLKMADRFKGEIVMPHDQKNEHKCTGCGICEISCPNGSIEIISKFEMVDGKKKKVIDKHIYHLSMCTLCGLCVESCPSKALDFGNEFEHATFDRISLTKILNKPDSKVQQDIKE